MSNELDTVINSMPEPSPSIITPPEVSGTTPTPEQSTVTKDKAGTPLDPSRHMVDAEGNPILNRDGRFRLRAGRKGNSISATHPKAPVSALIDPDAPAPSQDQQGNPLPPTPEPVDYDALAEQVVALEQVGFLTVMGHEWQFEQQEAKLLKDAWKRYLQAKGAKDLPPWVELTAMHAIIVTTRLRKPETQTRLGKFREWVGGIIGRWKARRSGRKPQPTPPAQPAPQAE